MKFIHCADVHLGKAYPEKDGSKNPTTYQDFFAAFQHIVTSVIQEQADALLIAGDLFHQGEISPLTLHLALEALQPLKSAGIPVIAIEGNHDRVQQRRDDSWLEFLARRGFIYLLSPALHPGDNRISFEPVPPGGTAGGKLSLKGVNFYGMGYHGSFGADMVLKAVPALAAERNAVLLFHTGVWEYSMIDIGKLKPAELAPLKPFFGYVALGHGHNRYEVEDWAFNPGSALPVNVGEVGQNKGFFVVEYNPGLPQPLVSLQAREIPCRPYWVHELDLSGAAHPDAALESFAQHLESLPQASSPAPCVWLRLTGTLNFHSYALPLEEMETLAIRHLQPAYLNLENRTRLAGVPGTARSGAGMEQLVLETIEAMIKEDSAYQPYAAELSRIILNLKQQQALEPGQLLQELHNSRIALCS